MSEEPALALLAQDGVGEPLRPTSNLRLKGDRGISMASRGADVFGRVGGVGARREGCNWLYMGKKSSNDNPSAPVRTTRRESRFASELGNVRAVNDGDK